MLLEPLVTTLAPPRRLQSSLRWTCRLDVDANEQSATRAGGPLDCFDLKPAPPALATDPQYPLPNGGAHASLNDFDAVGHTPQSRQVRGRARVTRYVLVLLKDSEEFCSVDHVRRLARFLSLCQRAASRTHVARVRRRLSGRGDFAAFHGHGPRWPNRVRNSNRPTIVGGPVCAQGLEITLSSKPPNIGA